MSPRALVATAVVLFSLCRPRPSGALRGTRRGGAPGRAGKRKGSTPARSTGFAAPDRAGRAALPAARPRRGRRGRAADAPCAGTVRLAIARVALLRRGTPAGTSPRSSLPSRGTASPAGRSTAASGRARSGPRSVASSAGRDSPWTAWQAQRPTRARRPSSAPYALSRPVGARASATASGRVAPLPRGCRFPGPLREGGSRAAAGRVVARWDSGGYGTPRGLLHRGRVHTLYAHLSRIGVRRGQRVSAGTRLGRVGLLGRLHGPAPPLRGARPRRRGEPATRLCASSFERCIAAWIAFRNAARTPACSSSRIAAIVVPPGEVTISRSSTGCILSSRRSLAVPSIVWTTSSVATSARARAGSPPRSSTPRGARSTPGPSRRPP